MGWEKLVLHWLWAGLDLVWNRSKSDSVCFGSCSPAGFGISWLCAALDLVGVSFGLGMVRHRVATEAWARVPSKQKQSKERGSFGAIRTYQHKYGSAAAGNREIY